MVCRETEGFMSLAICPGSFDPITRGHIDIIRRAALLFDRVIVVMMINPSKDPAFSAEERMDFIRRTTAGIPNIEVDYYVGLLADYAAKCKATAIVKGLRVMSDFEYEFQMALMNRSLNPGTETIFLPASIDYMFLSSSAVREVGRYGGDIAPLVPDEILDEVKQRLCVKKGL